MRPVFDWNIGSRSLPLGKRTLVMGIVNVVSAFRWDPAMAKTVAGLKCGAVLMHMRGRPEEWRTLEPPSDIVVLVKRELREWSDAALLAGVKRERMVLDPGFGFGKNFE